MGWLGCQWRIQNSNVLTMGKVIGDGFSPVYLIAQRRNAALGSLSVTLESSWLCRTRDASSAGWEMTDVNGCVLLAAFYSAKLFDWSVKETNGKSGLNFWLDQIFLWTLVQRYLSEWNASCSIQSWKVERGGGGKYGGKLCGWYIDSL
jgi:hypothetical protein